MTAADADMAQAWDVLDLWRRGQDMSMDSLAAAIAAALKAARGGWMPIETAPKDGTRILAIWNGVRHIIYWHTAPAVPGTRFGPVARWMPDSNRVAVNYEPTKWRPLPALPEAP